MFITEYKFLISYQITAKYGNKKVSQSITDKPTGQVSLKLHAHLKKECLQKVHEKCVLLKLIDNKHVSNSSMEI